MSRIGSCSASVARQEMLCGDVKERERYIAMDGRMFLNETSTKMCLAKNKKTEKKVVGAIYIQCHH